VGECLRGSHIVSEQGPERADGYRAFISYSHRDDGIAKTLHKRLETYRLPKKLIGRPSERGPIPARLTPIFRDLDELSAADDLSVEIKAALARSEVLIILCSPGAKASKWVNLEIETFRALHGNSRPVLAALIEGEPAEAFPPALTANGQEPVAADFRKNAPGGKRLALLKLVAGITAAPLDALVQRDTQRQYRRVMAITGGALAASLVMALLLVVALRSQAEAQRQRQEAEGLVEYMLTDLRDKLKGVTTLDVMNAVNERAMKYYGQQDGLEKLPVDSLLRRARILHAMGEDDALAGNLERALDKFGEAHRVTYVNLKKQPENSKAIFAHAQSQYWIAYTHQKKSDYSNAIKLYKERLNLLERYKSTQSQQLSADKEIGWTNNALGVIYLNGLSDPQAALVFFRNYQRIFSKLSINYPSDHTYLYSLSDSFGWIADSYFALNELNKAKDIRYKQIEIIDSLLRLDPVNHNYIWSKIGAGRAIFKICYRIKNNTCSRQYITLAERLALSTSYDFNNVEWIWMLIYVKLDKSFLEIRLNNRLSAKKNVKEASFLYKIYKKKNSQDKEKISEIQKTIDKLMNLL
jgi:tetratricopeptide (TPR) repeat protein